ncbi:MAG TPA: hypothetical protein DCZ63_08500 [Geobacter sp.]|nr:hypothetical protein [Geobacter sp.]
MKSDNAQAPDMRFLMICDPLAREGDGDQGGDGGDQGSDGDQGQGDGGSLLQNRGGNADDQGGQNNDGDQGGAFVIPDKFLVKNAAGEIDHKGTLEKLGQSYTHLEKRLGAGEAPPETPDKYKLDKYLPDGYDEKPEAMKPIIERFHKAGLNNKQLQEVMNVFGEQLANGLAQEKADMTAAMGTLKQAWKGAEYDKNMERANVALNTLAAPEEVKAITGDPKLMNNPNLIRLLAAMGRELEDDHSARDSIDAAEIDSLDELYTSEAYTNAKHKDHDRVVTKMQAAFARGYKPPKLRN